MSGQQAVLQVVILRDGLLVGTEVFVPGSYSLGSDPASDLQLDDPSVSPRHAVLYFQNGRSAIQDAGSSTGLYVNGHRVKACEIRPSDEVICGPFVLKTRVLQKRPQDTRPQPPPEVAALLGGNPSAAVPAAAVPASPPTPVPPRTTSSQNLATVPHGRPSGMMRAVSTPVPPEALADTQPSASAQRVARASVPQAAVAPAPAPIPMARPGPTPAAQPARPSTQPYGAAAVAAVPAPAQPSVPSSTMPSTRRRAPVPVQAQGTEPGILLTEDLIADLPPDMLPAQAEAEEPSEPFAQPLERPTHAPRLEAGRGGPAHLYLELYWGGVRREARRFAPSKKPVHAAADELAPMPLWGFQLSEEPLTLAESANGTWRFYVPPGSAVERSGTDGRYVPAPANALESEGGKRFITLRSGAAARISQGQLSLVAYAAPLPEKVRINPLKGVPWLALSTFLLVASAAGAFLVTMPKTPETADFTQKNLPPVALRLIKPEAKKKEEAKKKLEKIKEKAEKAKKVEKPVAKPQPQPQQQVEKPAAKPAAAEAPAIKALAKLTAAGPATKDLLAAVDKLGSGPGSKFVKNSNFKLSGLIGKAPIANAGLGTFGLGGGGKGGGATLGAEILRGKGGGGIGALGAGGVGKGAVGGTVTRATARAIAAQGTIDREGVARVVNSHLQEVHACYERALLKDPGLAGKVVLEWTISTDGRVAAAKTKSSTLKNASVEACILSNLKTWTFPPAKGGVVIITYPFLFNSVGY